MRNSLFWNHFQEQGLFKQNTLSETICIKGQTPSEAECAEIAILQNLGNYPFVVFVFNRIISVLEVLLRGQSWRKEFNSAALKLMVPRKYFC